MILIRKVWISVIFNIIFCNWWTAFFCTQSCNIKLSQKYYIIINFNFNLFWNVYQLQCFIGKTTRPIHHILYICECSYAQNIYFLSNCVWTLEFILMFVYILYIFTLTYVFPTHYIYIHIYFFVIKQMLKIYIIQ